MIYLNTEVLRRGAATWVDGLKTLKSVGLDGSDAPGTIVLGVAVGGGGELPDMIVRAACFDD